MGVVSKVRKVEIRIIGTDRRNNSICDVPCKDLSHRVIVARYGGEKGWPIREVLSIPIHIGRCIRHTRAEPGDRGGTVAFSLLEHGNGDIGDVLSKDFKLRMRSKLTSEVWVYLWEQLSRKISMEIHIVAFNLPGASCRRPTLLARLH